MIEKLSVPTSRKREMIDITRPVQEAAAKAGLKDGLCCVWAPHTTAGVTVNEGADPHVQADILQALARLVPASGGYAHAEGNADAHIQSALTGPGVTLPVDGGRLCLGTWQKIFLCEYDGPRPREVWLRFVRLE